MMQITANVLLKKGLIQKGKNYKQIKHINARDLLNVGLINKKRNKNGKKNTCC